MLALVKPFVQLCLLRIGPQDLPASLVLLGVALAAHTLTGIVVSLMFLPTGAALVSGLVGTLLVCILTFSVLYIQRLRERVCQTLTAMAGAIALIDVTGIPVLGWLQSVQSAGASPGTPTLLLLFLTGWSLTVQGHILRSALSTRFMFGLILAIFFFWISYNVMRTLFPVPA